MAKRTGVSPSVRWQVFARDGFRCRYCGVQAGQEGVELHVDHLVSVVEGGDNGRDNLVTACKKCNGGKSGRSLCDAPGSAQAIQNSLDAAKSLEAQADAIAAEIRARKRVRQSVINLLCNCYGVEEISVSDQDISHYVTLIREHGPTAVAEWISLAVGRDVKPWRSIQYVYGIIRKLRQEEAS